MDNTVEYLGTYPELAQIYANADFCERFLKYFPNLPFSYKQTDRHLEIHNKIFEDLISIAKRIAMEKEMSSSRRANWQSHVSELAKASYLCLNDDNHHHCHVLSVIKDIFEKLKIKIE